jgi:hypothetical protein
MTGEKSSRKGLIMSNMRIPFLVAASVSSCALLASTAALAGTLSYTGTGCATLCSGPAFGTLALPVGIAFADVFSSGQTSATDEWSFTLPSASAAATGSGLQFGADGISGTISSFQLYTAANVLVANGTSFASGVFFAIPPTPLAAGSYYLKVVADGNYAGTLSAVPLPASAWLMVSGVAGLLVLARRRRDPMASSSSAS